MFVMLKYMSFVYPVTNTRSNLLMVIKFGLLFVDCHVPLKILYGFLVCLTATESNSGPLVEDPNRFYVHVVKSIVMYIFK